MEFRVDEHGAVRMRASSVVCVEFLLTESVVHPFLDLFFPDQDTKQQQT